MLLFIIIYR